jgi:hypothetical protein
MISLPNGSLEFLENEVQCRIVTPFVNAVCTVLYRPCVRGCNRSLRIRYVGLRNSVPNSGGLSSCLVVLVFNPTVFSRLCHLIFSLRPFGFDSAAPTQQKALSFQESQPRRLHSISNGFCYARNNE